LFARQVRVRAGSRSRRPLNRSLGCGWLIGTRRRRQQDDC
jgi:hypothetical protein